MDLIFCKLKKLKKDEFNVLQALKRSKNMNIIFCQLQKNQNHEILRFGKIMLC